MAAIFLLLAVLIGVVLVDAVLENSATATTTLFDRSFDQLSTGEQLVAFAALGFLLALFLFMAFGSSRTRRARRKELRSARRDAEGRVGELERENERLRQELERTGRTGRLGRPEQPVGATNATTTQAPVQRGGPPPQPTNMRRERIDDRSI
jgi:membrane protein implicated in regulation of membrane protease activity